MNADHSPEETVTDIGGDELTRLLKRTRKGDFATMLRQFADDHGPDVFDTEIARIKNGCDAILRSHELPGANDGVEVDGDGNWSPAAKTASRTKASYRSGFQLCTGATYVLERENAFSMEWYAAKIGELCWLISEADNPADSVRLMRVLELGRWIEDRSWRSTHKENIKTGRPVLAGAKAGGNSLAGKFAPETKKVIAEMEACLAKMPRPSIKRAAELVASRGTGKNAEANRSRWYAHQKRKL